MQIEAPALVGDVSRRRLSLMREKIDLWRGLLHAFTEYLPWVNEGIVDELWVQLGSTGDQRAAMDLLLKECEGKPVKLTVRTVNPFDPGWKPYVKAGVTPVAVITWARNGIERFALEPTSLKTLKSPDWRLRLQTVADIERGKIKADGATIAGLASDAHVLVRRRVMYALGAVKAADQVKVLEEGLLDAESSVRIAAAGALAKVHGAESSTRIMSALEKDGYFQMKMACVQALSAMKEKALPDLLKGIESPICAVREVSVRALYKLGKAGVQNHVYAPLRAAMLDQEEDERIRYYALEGLVGLRMEIPAARQQQLASDLMAIAAADPSITVQLHAAWGLGHMYGLLTPALRGQALKTLSAGFRKYGDACRRPDAAFGWRVFGNAMLQYHERGRDVLEEMRAQTDDKWLVWLAYEVVHLPHRSFKIVQVDERAAVEAHERYAPAFPGYRKW